MGNMNYPQQLKQLIARRDLSEGEAFDMVNAILAGELTEGQTGAFLAALAAKGETIDEIAGGARAMRATATRIQSLCADTHDTVGTGGDGGITFNISTTVAFVAAGAGAVVAKHGNRASSGRSGSADCLEHLGFNLAADPELLEEALNEIGITFLFAPAFHKAMRFAGPVRRQIGVRTIFNVLGPLTNPAGAPCQLIGVFAPELTETIAQVMRKLGSRRVLVVHGLDGMDEITLTGPTRCSELKDGRIRTYDIDPLAYFPDTCTPEARPAASRRECRHHARHPDRQDPRTQARYRADQRRRLAHGREPRPRPRHGHRAGRRRHRLRRGARQAGAVGCLDTAIDLAVRRQKR